MPHSTLGPSGIRLRVHFAAVGFEVDRIVRPMEDMKADVGVLLSYSYTDRAQKPFEEVVRKLKSDGLGPLILNTDLWDPSQVVDVVGATVSSAPQHEYFFNVSTGPKPACVAGTMAAMFWRIRPYYAGVDYSKELFGPGDHPTVGPPTFITTMVAAPPDKQSMMALAFLVTRAKPVSKKELLAHMVSTRSIGAQSGESASPQSLHGQLDSVLGRLEAWGFVRREGRGKPMRIHLTDSGKGGYKMFHHSLAPRPPPTELQI